MGDAGEGQKPPSTSGSEDITPPAQNSPATPAAFIPPLASGHFLPPRSQGRDPRSSSQPLPAYDHSIFQAAFPTITSSSMVWSDSSTNAAAAAATAAGPSRGNPGGTGIRLPNSLTGSISNTSPPPSSFSAASASRRDSYSAVSVSATSPTSNVVYTPKSEQQEDPFFYPFLCANERKRLRAFWSLTAGMHDDKGLADYLQNLLTIVKQLYGFDTAAIQFIDNDRASSLDSLGWGDSACPRRETACAHTMLLQPGAVLSVSDFLSDPRFANNQRMIEAQMRTYAGVPLAYTAEGSGETISLGSLCVFSFISEKPPLTEGQKECLSRFADLATHAIKDRSRLRRETVQTKRHETLSMLATVTGPPSQVVEATIAALKSTLGGECTVVETSDQCIYLREVGRVSITDFESGVWDNIPAIDDFIKYHNHESSYDYDPGCTVRAMAVPITGVRGHYLVIESGNLRDIFDGTDILFVQSCAMVIASSIQHGLLSQALESKTTFLRNAQHTFRTSLNGILSATDMLLSEGTSHIDGVTGQKRLILEPDPNGTTPLELLRVIETSGRGLLTVINHLIDLDAHNMASASDLCDIHEIEEDVLDSIMQNSSKERIKDILIISDSRLDAGKGDCIISDRLLLRQTIASLVQNAVEATSGGGMVKLKMSLVGQPGVDQSLDVEVEDTGVGIAQSDQERIFQAFEKVDPYSANVGLGLTFAYQYAATLGGSVSLIRSAPGEGSLFRLRLPNPVLACSLAMHMKRKQLPEHWSYWMNELFDGYDCDKVYGQSLQGIGIPAAKSLYDADIVIQSMTQLPPNSDRPEALSRNQVLLMLGWEEDYHSRPLNLGDAHRTVYGRLPWTRKRLIATLLKAKGIAVSEQAAKLGQTPAQEIAKLDLDSQNPRLVRALLVDDNAMNLHILQAYCKKRGYFYDSARDGEKAFEAYKTACEKGQQPNICLLDMQMPICDGIACARLIREYEKERNCIPCPIVMVTAQSGDADRQAALGVGTDAYYVKPLRIATLDDIMARYARL